MSRIGCCLLLSSLVACSNNTSPITLKVPRRGVRFVRSSFTTPIPKISGPSPLYRAPGFWRGAPQ